MLDPKGFYLLHKLCCEKTSPFKVARQTLRAGRNAGGQDGSMRISMVACGIMATYSSPYPHPPLLSPPSPFSFPASLLPPTSTGFLTAKRDLMDIATHFYFFFFFFFSLSLSSAVFACFFPPFKIDPKVCVE